MNISIEEVLKHPYISLDNIETSFLAKTFHLKSGRIQPFWLSFSRYLVTLRKICEGMTSTTEVIWPQRGQILTQPNLGRSDGFRQYCKDEMSDHKGAYTVI